MRIPILSYGALLARDSAIRRARARRYRRRGHTRQDAAHRANLDSVYDSYWRSRTHPLRRRIAAIVADYQPRSVLEVGSGAGALLAAIHREIPHAALTGVDQSRPVIEYARRRGPYATHIVGDHRGPFEPHDVVVTCGLFTCIPPGELEHALRAAMEAATRAVVLAEAGPPEGQDGQDGEYWRRDYAQALQQLGLEAVSVPVEAALGHMDTITVATSGILGSPGPRAATGQ